MSGQSPRHFGKTSLGPPMKTVAVIGGGPAGLRAAEMAISDNVAVTVFDAKASVGRKFLVAGRGGLNLTKDEPLDRFLLHYDGPDFPRPFWSLLLAAFPPEALRRWAAELGVETFAASTGRVYPREMKAAPLLRRWVQRLREKGVTFATRHRWVGLRSGEKLELDFVSADGPRTIFADAGVLALGGGSWPETGSDGGWIFALQRRGIVVSPLQPANCGWEAAWPGDLRLEAEGEPVKNITARAGNREAVGELLITRHGLEGGVIYQLGPALRAMSQPILFIDLKPGVSSDQLVKKLGLLRRNFLPEARQRWRLSTGAFALLRHLAPPGAHGSADALAAITKALPVPLARPRPITEAISSAGGVAWPELDETLMLKKLPGVFCAGEMIDWEAPTGGYLMQACFATGTLAGKNALAWALRP
jgi:uncharacterized flavoprotein (TIGR03862 family)